MTSIMILCLLQYSPPPLIAMSVTNGYSLKWQNGQPGARINTQKAGPGEYYVAPGEYYVIMSKCTHTEYVQQHSSSRPLLLGEHILWELMDGCVEHTIHYYIYHYYYSLL